LNEIGSYIEYTSDMSIHSKITEIVQAIFVYIQMDQNWINLSHINAEYEKGIEEFIQYVQLYEGKSEKEVKF